MIGGSWEKLGERDLLGVGEVVTSGSGGVLLLCLWLLMVLLCGLLVVLGGRDCGSGRRERAGVSRVCGCALLTWL